MKVKINQKLYELAECLDKPLYVVGGYVRNYLISGSASADVDLSSSISPNKIVEVAKKLGFSVDAVYRRTNTALLIYGDLRCEYTAFRRERYPDGGSHLPIYTEQTDKIEEDALRRDFKCNAVYYDIKNDEFVDPLGGLEDIKNKVLDCADLPENTFASDGLRLMRLARFAGELGFTPTEGTVAGAKTFADNIKGISEERIFDELKKILRSDKKYPFSDPRGHYTGLKILDEIGVIDRIFPELALGRGMSQRADFHKYDVLEHSLRTALYADEEVRLGAFLHDVGKPYCMKKFGEYAAHAEYGEKIAVNILKRLKADAKTVKLTAYLVGAHMKDLYDDMTEDKIRKYIADNVEYIPQLLMVKQADFSAGKDGTEVAPTVKKWQAIFDKMKGDGTPFSSKDLKISAEDLIEIGFFGAHIGAERVRLREYAIYDPTLNNREALIALAKKDFDRQG